MSENQWQRLVPRLHPHGPTVFGEMGALAARTGAVNLGQGFPDEAGPEELRAIAMAEVSDPLGNQYPPAHGRIELRKAIAEHQRDWYGLDYDPHTEVVVGTCPDLGTVRPIATPLRQMARRMSRELAAAQYIGVRDNGGRPVALAELLGHRFDDEPDMFFSADRFHPSVTGYAACADELLPEVLAALGLERDTPALPSS